MVVAERRVPMRAPATLSVHLQRLVELRRAANRASSGIKRCWLLDKLLASHRNATSEGKPTINAPRKCLLTGVGVRAARRFCGDDI